MKNLSNTLVGNTSQGTQAIVNVPPIDQHFNTIADKIEPGTKGGSVDCSELYNLLNKYPNAVEQIEILKKDYLGAK